MKTDFIEQLRQIVAEFSAFEVDHAARLEQTKKTHKDLAGSEFYNNLIAKHNAELPTVRNAALEKIAAIEADFSQYLARGYQIDGSFLHPDSQIFPLLNSNELKDMAGKHNGNSTMLRALCAECERRGISNPPVIPREHRQEGYDFLLKMARAAVNDATTPTRAVFTDDAVWPTAWLSHKQAADVSDFARHFERYESAILLKIPPQFDAA